MYQQSSNHGQYEQLFKMLSLRIPAERLIRDPLRTLAYGTDASFYRLIPKMVVRVQSESDVICTMRACANLAIPFTFRAAGTSLSGQAISDSVLIQLSRLWNGINVSADGLTARFEPAVLGCEANRALLPFQRKIGPDPASVDSAMVAGIAANNASGMCCGNIQDTYHTMASLRVVFPDGSSLDTGSENSRKSFLAERADLVSKVAELACRVKEKSALTQRIRHKYRIKNTTGYSLHALIDFEDPLEIIAHLLIGSEGTLGFISEITYNTVPDPPFRATSLVVFPDMRSACDASFHLSRHAVAAVELMDRQSLRSIQTKSGMPAHFTALGQEVTSLLVEIRADSAEAMRDRVLEVSSVLANCHLHEPVSFTEDKLQSKRLWDIRKGLFPSLGQARQDGTTILIEDVAFPAARLADATIDLRDLLNCHGHRDAVIFGHALQGNLHFVFCVDFNRDEETRKYEAFLEDMTTLVTAKYDGSLKAEHGTGRNMAPFVEREWGPEAFGIMRDIKRIFDPQNLLNPGVILSDNPQIHVSDLKTTPPSHPLIEKCTECGFCERTCPSQNLSLTPRQRIVIWREISRLTVSGEDRKRLRQLRKDFAYAGDKTCAVDGLCATLCPLGIDTGAFIKELRGKEHSRVGNLLADASAENLDILLSCARFLLRSADAAHSIFGATAMKWLTHTLRELFGNEMPEWNSWLPKPSSPTSRSRGSRTRDNVIYFPSCISRLFGISANSLYQDSQNARIESLLVKAGYTAHYPAELGNLCCGLAFSSKGYSQQADKKMLELVHTLDSVSQNGRYPIFTDTSPCAQRLKAYRDKPVNLRIYDIIDFLMDFVVPRVNLHKRSTRVALHVPCSLRKTGLDIRILELAKLCAENVCVPESTPCCGFAGDRGFTTPELTASALVNLKSELPPDCQAGYSSSRTCEIGVSLHSGISYQSIAYLVDEAM